MIYPLVDVLKKAYPVTQVCDTLSVQKSSYYYWQAHREPPVARQHLQLRVKAIHACRSARPMGAVACRMP